MCFGVFMANEVSKIYSDIAELLNVARAKAYHSVNSIMVETYWKIGQRIVKEEQGGSSRAEYGTKLIENLSKYLTDTFGKGFSEANLQNMRKFYLTYPEFPTQCVGNLSWTNVRSIMLPVCLILCLLYLDFFLILLLFS